MSWLEISLLIIVFIQQAMIWTYRRWWLKARSQIEETITMIYQR